MDNSQVFLILFLQNVLNFFSLYFFLNKYSRIVNDINIHFEKTTRLFLDHLIDMYEYSSGYWRRSSSRDNDDEDDDEGDDDDYEGDEEEEEDDYEGDEEEVNDGDDTEDCEKVDDSSESCTSSGNTTCCVQEEETFSQNCI